MLTDGVVTLTPARLEEAEAIAATVQASLHTLVPWMHWATPDYDAESARCGLQNPDDPQHCIELGYWLGSAYTGNGYATLARPARDRARVRVPRRPPRDDLRLGAQRAQSARR